MAERRLVKTFSVDGKSQPHLKKYRTMPFLSRLQFFQKKLRKVIKKYQIGKFKKYINLKIIRYSIYEFQNVKHSQNMSIIIMWSTSEGKRYPNGVEDRRFVLKKWSQYLKKNENLILAFENLLNTFLNPSFIKYLNKFFRCLI